MENIFLIHEILHLCTKILIFLTINVKIDISLKKKYFGIKSDFGIFQGHLWKMEIAYMWFLFMDPATYD